ncbi:MAG TPA: DUF4105 domain-containing protein [Gemmatimonadales bacterium]|nr:DUF4105 domain-containing protein [Gemmatimonadales bacterium]
MTGRRVGTVLLAAGLAVAGGGAPTSAQESGPRRPAMAEPGAELTVYVMTMGPGERIWERFGHNAIWIVDTARGTSKAYNYGLFSFRQENFLLRFVQGRMLYWMGSADGLEDAARYAADGRAVWVQELDLPPTTRAALRDFLEWNERPENRFYRYDYYLDNCSTRVRDALDRVLGGIIRAQLDTVPTGTTYRSHTRALTAPDPLLYTGIHFLLGHPADRALDAWDEGFLPLRLRDHLRRVTVTHADGRVVPLVRAERALYESALPPPPSSPPAWVPAYLAIGGAVGLALVRLGRRAGRTGGRGFGLAGAGWAFLGGLAGLVLLGMWFFTDHVVASRNENLLQANPLLLPLALVLPRIGPHAKRLAPLAVGLAAGAAGLSLLGLVVQLLPGFDQPNGEILALMVPANLGLALGTRLAAGSHP